MMVEPTLVRMLRDAAVLLHENADQALRDAAARYGSERWFFMARATLCQYWRGQLDTPSYVREQDWAAINAIDRAEQRLMLERCAADLEQRADW